MKKKKVLILVNHDLVIYNFRKELVSSLISKGYDVIISCPPSGEKLNELKKMGAFIYPTFIDRHGISFTRDLRLIRKYKQIYKEINPDIIISYTIKPNIYGAIANRRLKKPYIANITGLGNAIERKGLLQKIVNILYKYAFKNINYVFFQNQYNMEYFAKNNIAKNKNILVPGSGVNLEEFTILDYPKNEKINFAFISRVMKEKGIDEYLEAAKKLHHLANFKVIGFFDGDYEKIIQRFENEGYIKYLGFTKDVRKVLTSIDVVVLPSYHEGMSNILLESQASGRPVIGSNIPGVRETFVNLESGLLFENKNIEDLKVKMEEFINMNFEMRRIMGIKGREHVEKHFSRHLVVGKYLEKIEELIK